MDVAGGTGADTRPLERGLILAVLGSRVDTTAADHILEQAAALQVDPFEYCAHRLGLGDAEVMRRAAYWAGLAFYDGVPETLAVFPKVRGLDHLSEITTLKAQVLDRQVTFCAPRFEGMLRLAAAAASDPSLKQRCCVVTPRALRTRLTSACADELMSEARQRLTRRWPNASANVDLPRAVRIGFVIVFLLATVLVAMAPLVAFGFVLLPVVAALLVVPAALRFGATFAPRDRRDGVRPLSDAELPVYSILIPLRDEAAMVPLLQQAMTAIDYPPEKLDIRFVVEDRSAATIAAVEATLNDPRFELVIVPDALPRTKPKALNFALPLVRGKHVVVFDAEDIPDPSQLRLAASHFAADPSLDCVQAELVVDNAGENWLTALFAAEYAGQFGLMLPFLGQHRLPLPLGGTSNHFRTAALRELGHWDAFNVTEDADLGVRLSRLRYNSGTLSSETSEEAPVSLRGWMVQRTRWIKGWMQTFIVHNRAPGKFLADIGWRNFLFFQIYVGGLILSSLLHTTFLASLLARAVLGDWPEFTDPLDVAYLSILIFGYGGTFALVIAGLVRRRALHLAGYQLLLPVYWMLHSAAALNAAWQLLVRPYFWGKTAHGHTRQARRAPASGTPRHRP